MRMVPSRYLDPKPLQVKKNVAQIQHVSAPLKGLSQSSRLTPGDPLTAVILSNFVVDDDRITVRAGYLKVFTDADGKPIEALIPYYGQPQRMLAATNHKLVNGADGALLQAGFTSNDWHWTSYSNLAEADYTVMVNGADGVWSWDGGLTTDPGVVGPTGVSISKANPAVVTVPAGDIAQVQERTGGHGRRGDRHRHGQRQRSPPHHLGRPARQHLRIGRRRHLDGERRADHRHHHRPARLDPEGTDHPGTGRYLDQQRPVPDRADAYEPPVVRRQYQPRRLLSADRPEEHDRRRRPQGAAAQRRVPARRLHQGHVHMDDRRRRRHERPAGALLIERRGGDLRRHRSRNRLPVDRDLPLRRADVEALLHQLRRRSLRADLDRPGADDHRHPRGNRAAWQDREVGAVAVPGGEHQAPQRCRTGRPCSTRRAVG